MAVASLLIATAGMAQAPVEKMLAGMAASQQQLRQYTFRQRTETYARGELRNTRVDEVHYTDAGERVSVVVDEHAAEMQAPRRGPGHRLIERKMLEEKEKMKEYIGRLAALAARYHGPDPATLQAALPAAEFITGGGSRQVRVRFRNYVKNRDSMTMTFDPDTHRPVQTDINTFLDEDPVSIVVTFHQVHSGPSYPGRIVINSAARQVELRLSTYDYRM